MALGSTDKPRSAVKKPPVNAILHNRAMLLVMVGLCLYGLLNQDRMPVGNGFGWDGQTYAVIASNPSKALLVDGQTSYYVQRILPSLLVNLGLVFTLTPITAPSIVMGFLVLNTVMLLGATAIYGRLADFLKLEPQARWLGFCLIFLNVNAIKAGFYYGTLTDITTLALAVAMSYFYLASRTAALAWTLLVASFTVSTAVPLGAFLLLFPVASSPPYQRSGLPPARSSTPKILAVLISTMVAGRLIYVYRVEQLRGIGYGDVVPVFEPLFYLSVLCVAVYVCMVFAWFFSLLTSANVFQALRTLTLARVVIVLAVALPAKLLGIYLGVGKIYTTVGRHFDMVIFEAATRPAVSLVAHFIYYGLVFALLPLVGRRFFVLIGRWGTGAVLFICLSLAILISPESRHGILCYPMLAVAVLVCLEKSRTIRTEIVWIVAALSLAMSRIWQPFNTGLLNVDGQPDVSRYFGTQGFQLPNADYAAHLVLLVLVSIGLAMTMPRKAEDPLAS